jgi:arabinogalactan oligomer/maltooligosaccharide transport system permease protein
MVGWSGRRMTLTVLLFLAPTIIGLIIFNVYPILLNTYISFTTRNKFHPNPDCTVALTGVLDPLCWPAFKGKAPVGLGEPYRLQEPLFQNYATILGDMFNPESLKSLLLIVVTLIPLVVVTFINRRLDRMISRPLGSAWVWLGGIIGIVLIGWLVNIGGAIDTIMQTGDFIIVVFRTLLFVALRVPLCFLVGLVLALILNSPNLKGKTFFRVALFIPWAASSVAILMALVWQFLFRGQGTINQVLAVFGIVGPTWLNSPELAFGVVVIADVWFSYGFFMVAILGALQSIPVEVYEAARVDGASWWQQLKTITLPLLRSAILPAVVLTSITAFQMFGSAYAITAGGPIISADKPGVTDFVMVYAYKQIFQLGNFGKATAFAVVIFIMLFLATLYSLRLTKITRSAYES